MTHWLQLVGLCVLFAASATVVYRRWGRVGRLRFLLIWFGLAAIEVVVALPRGDQSVHDFERSPLPGVLLHLIGVASALAVFGGLDAKPPSLARAALGAVVYCVAGTAAVVGWFLVFVR